MSFSDLLPGVPLVESPFFEQLVVERGLDEPTIRVARELREKGYAIIDLVEPDLDAMIARIKGHLGPQFAWDDWRDRGYADHSGLRVQDAWTFDEDTRRIAANPAVLELLGALYGRPAFPFQTLTFPVGTQQHLHTDAVHFHCVPERFMCGVWVALEDIHEDAGPLVYVPGSHRFPVFTNEHIGRCAARDETLTSQASFEPLWRGLIEAHQLETERFRAKKGQALIWAANLLHGGDTQRDPSLTRWSQVTHYYFEDCVYFTPMRSDPLYGSVEFREVVDVRTGESVAPRYAGQPLDANLVERFRPPRPELPEGFDAARYLEANPDVARAGMDAADHWLMYGKREGRRLTPEDE
ncbi:MAG: phytanoyl-CoA dioxygenase family protein [Sandaracinaceae bacterium]